MKLKNSNSNSISGFPKLKFICHECGFSYKTSGPVYKIVDTEDGRHREVKCPRCGFDIIAFQEQQDKLDREGII